MGCVSQNGCLGPRRRERQVYAQLIELIHEQAKKVHFGQQGKQSPRNMNIYAAIRQKLVKKGYLRKLLDNLTTHRSKIYDCLNYNLRIVTQSDSLEHKYAGLIILNELTASISKEARSKQLIPNDDDKTLVRSGQSTAKLIKLTQMTGVVIDNRFDASYFRFILHLLQNQGRMYMHILESLINFSRNRKQKTSCKTEVWRVLDIILQKLQRGSYVAESSLAYQALLEQLKEGGKEDSTHEKELLSFFKLWFKEQGQDDLNEASEASLRTKYQRIIKELVKRFMNSWDSKILYRTLFIIYDQQKFADSKMRRLEDLIMGYVLDSDLHSHILRGIFLYMLEYLAVCPNSQKASYRSSVAEQFQTLRFPRINDKPTKIKAFQTLRRWGTKQYINLDQSVNFSSSALVGAYIGNMTGDKQYVQEVVREFLRLSQLLKRKSNLIIVNLLLQQIKFEQTEEPVRKLLINLVRQIIQARKLLNGPLPDTFSYFIPLQQTFSRQTRIQLIQLMGFIIRNLTKDQLSIHEQFANNTVLSLCQLFYSLYQGIIFVGVSSMRHSRKQQDEDMLHRYQYINAILSLLKCLIEKASYEFVLGFMYSLNSKLIVSSDVMAPPTLTLYFHLYLLFQGMHMVNQRQKIPDKMASINFKITPSLKSVELKPEMESLVDQLLGSNGQFAQKLSQANAIIIQQLREFTMLSVTQFQQILSYFSNYFKSIRKNQNASVQGISLQMSKTQFKRQSMNGSFFDSYHDRSKHQDDDSFRDIMERIGDN